MRLLTHNMLASNVKVRAFRSSTSGPAFRSRRWRHRAAPKPATRSLTVSRPRSRLVPFSPPSQTPLLRQGTTSGFPLRIEVLQKEERDAEFHVEFLVNTLGKIEWDAFVGAARSIGADDGLPNTKPEVDVSNDEAFLRAFHHALLEVHVQEGYLVCPDSGRRFPITKGIPNMLLNEDEV